MFDFHITCTRKIKSLNVVFDDSELPEEPTASVVDTAPSSTFDLTERVKSAPKTQRTHKVLTPEIIELDRPVKIAEELNNLEF